MDRLPPKFKTIKPNKIMSKPLRSCFAPPNYKPQKHVTFASSPIICSSIPFLDDDDDYSEDEAHSDTQQNQAIDTTTSLKDGIIFKSIIQTKNFLQVAITLLFIFTIASLLTYFDFINISSPKENAINVLHLIAFVPIIHVIASNFIN